jgi:16S rRNA (guanine(966)-N(2))-methyltransferase RsmD
MLLRVISGTARGKRLKVPKGNIRPLSEQAREALFNILAPRIAESDFLDLFAGSGAVGIEALSRGARLAIFVEIDKKSVPVIWENLNNTGFSDLAEVYALPVAVALKILNKKDAKFDIIFLGAPYGSPNMIEAMKYLGDSSLIKDSGVVIAEHRFSAKGPPKAGKGGSAYGGKYDISEAFGFLTMFRKERYGDTVFSFFKR